MQKIKVEREDGCAFGVVEVGVIFLYNNNPYIKLSNDRDFNCKKLGAIGIGTISRHTRVTVPEEIIIK